MSLKLICDNNIFGTTNEFVETNMSANMIANISPGVCKFVCVCVGGGLPLWLYTGVCRPKEVTLRINVNYNKTIHWYVCPTIAYDISKWHRCRTIISDLEQKQNVQFWSKFVILELNYTFSNNIFDILYTNFGISMLIRSVMFCPKCAVQ